MTSCTFRYLCFLLLSCLLLFISFQLCEGSNKDMAEPNTQYIKNPKVKSVPVENIPQNLLKNLQERIDAEIDTTITYQDIIDKKPCYPIDNENPDLILGYDPTVSYLVYRYNDFVDVHHKHKKRCGSHCQTDRDCRHASNSQCRQCHRGKCNPKRPKCQCPNGTVDRKQCKNHGQTICKRCNEGYFLDPLTLKCVPTCLNYQCSTGTKTRGPPIVCPPSGCDDITCCDQS